MLHDMEGFKHDEIGELLGIDREPAIPAVTPGPGCCSAGSSVKSA
ncbi:MAG: hypothetical protein R2882_09655 [Gemmatimonadales bacterium]